MEEEDDLNDLKEEYEQSKELLEEADKELEELEKRTKLHEKSGKRNYQKLLKENEDLEREHKNNIKEIKEYEAHLDELQKKLNSQNSEIKALTKENERLKLNIIRKKSPERRRQPQIKTASDMRQSFGFILKGLKKYKKKEDNEEEEEKENYETPGLNNDLKKNEFEKLLKSKTDYEIVFHELREKINDYYKKMNNEKTYIDNYRSYINSLNERIRSFRQQLRISIIGQESLNFHDSSNKKVDQLSKDLESTSKIINQINLIFTNTKNRTLKNGENILNRIQTKLIEIDTNKNLTFYYLSNRIDTINSQIKNLKNLCQTLEKDMNTFYEKKGEIEKNIDSLKDIFEKFMENYKEGKQKINDAIHKKIRKIIRKNSKKIMEDVNKNLKNEEEEGQENEDLYVNVKEEAEDYDLIHGSTLIGINDFGKNIDLFKSKILFEDKNEMEESRIHEAKMLKKNWNEVCYIYDDYDIHDVNYDLKAVGLKGFSFFNNSSKTFQMDKDIEILELEINGKQAKYQYRNHTLEFDINLKNLETAKVHLKYKEKPKLDSLDHDEIELRKFYRQEYYGLSEILKGQMGKFRLILKGSFDIVSFKNDIFLRNENNKQEKEYLCGGKIPPEGLQTLVQLSKKEATWSVNLAAQIINRNGNLKNSTLKVPIGYVGGNNEIINMSYSSPQTKNIEVDEENRIYEIKYKDTNHSRGDFIIKGEIKNRCQGEWNVDLSDETIESHMFEEDKKDKKQLEKIARKIIEDFDKKNKDNLHNYMDYAKIGRWVHDNLEYDLNYSGKTKMTALDIYNKRAGVCHHFTRLANALLYSIGYKVIYITGFACKYSGEFDTDAAHAWSLINVGGKWYPFDVTWGILSGKLPVCHIFQGFFIVSVRLSGTDGASFGDQTDENGKFIK